MSAYSTKTVTRERAQQVLIYRVQNASNDELERMLDLIWRQETLKNYSVVDRCDFEQEDMDRP